LAFKGKELRAYFDEHTVYAVNLLPACIENFRTLSDSLSCRAVGALVGYISSEEEVVSFVLLPSPVFLFKGCLEDRTGLLGCEARER
jgi:hypothetical protein